MVGGPDGEIEELKEEGGCDPPFIDGEEDEDDDDEEDDKVEDGNGNPGDVLFST